MVTMAKGSGAAARARRVESDAEDAEDAGDAEGAEEMPETAQPWWESLRSTLSDSAWTALGGKAAAYVAGFFALALVGSGHAISLLPYRSGGANAELALVYGGLTAAAAAPPAEAPPAPAEAGVQGDGDADAGAPGDADAGGVTGDGKVVLNLATEAEMRRLPGVGPAKAKAIVALRTKLKRFRKLEDLLRVKGLGRRSLKRLRPLVLIDPP